MMGEGLLGRGGERGCCAKAEKGRVRRRSRALWPLSARCMAAPVALGEHVIELLNLVLHLVGLVRMDTRQYHSS